MKTYLPSTEVALPETLDACLSATVRQFGNKEILHVYENDIVRQTYADLLKQAQGFAAVLREKGYKPGETMILSIERSEFFLTAFWGCVLAGIVSAPMPALQSIKEDAIETRRLVKACELLKCPVICDAAHHRAYGLLQQLTERTGSTLLNAADIIGESEIREHVFINQNNRLPGDLAVIQFSSGSTGDPKGVCLTHRNIITNVRGILERVNAVESDRMVYWMPYYHDFGLFGSHIRSLIAGIDQIRIDPRYFIKNPLVWLKCIDKYKANVTASTNTGLELLVRRMDTVDTKFNLAHLKHIYLGAEIIAADACEAFNRLLAPHGLNPAALSPGYGLAEATLVVTTAPVEEAVRVKVADRQLLYQENKVHYLEGAATASGIHCISVGKPIADFTLHIYDNQGGVLPAGRVGEIGVAGDSVTSGYRYNDAATASAIQHGVLYTGDMGFVDEEGNLYITGRKKELIIKNGVNYFPADIESAVSHEMGKAVKTVIACGFPDLQQGRDQLVIFFVAAIPGAAAEIAAAIRKTVNETIGFPPDVVVPLRSNQVPRTSSAKIMRLKLVQHLQDGVFNDTINMLTGMDDIKQNMAKAALEQLVRKIWYEALELPATFPLEERTGFFSIGGDSIRAVKAVALLEQQLGLKLEGNFLYQYPTVKEQLKFLSAIDASIVPPKDEIELIIRDVVAHCLNMDKQRLGMTTKILEHAGTLEDALKISQAIQHVFDIPEAEQALLKQPALRDVANYIRDNYWNAYTNDGSGGQFTLMNFQETLYYHSKSFLRNEPTGLSCYIIYRMPVTGRFDLTLFNKAFDHLIATHPMLRAVISEAGDMPFFRLQENVPPFSARYEDISHLAEPAQQAWLLKNDREDHLHRFDLTKYPLFYARVSRLSPLKHQVVIHIDHQLIDGYSFVQLVKELFEGYDQLCEGKTPVALTGQMQFWDYVNIEQLRARTPDYKKALDFALQVFRDIPPRMVLPVRNELTQIGKIEFDTYHTHVAPAVMDGIMQLVNQHEGISLNSLLLACYFRVMHIWTGQDDLIINMPVYNREHHFADARSVVGSFLDIFPVRIKIGRQESMISIARRCEKFIRALLQYPVSSIELTRLIAGNEGLKQGSLSNIIFSNSINMIPKGLVKTLSHLELGEPLVHTGAPGTLIDLVLYSWEGKWCFDWNYVCNLLDSGQVQTMATQFQGMLEALTKPSNAHDAVALYWGENLLPEKIRALYADVNKTGQAYPLATMHSRIAAQVQHTPDRVAVSFEGKTLTYRELDHAANRMARLLQELGVTAGQFVALIHHRSIALLVAQLAVLKAGGAYVPIDPNYPAERIAYMLRDAGATVIITQLCHASLLDNMHNTGAAHGVVTDLVDSEKAGRFNDRMSVWGIEDWVNRDGDPLPETSDPDQLMYMIYTSGSTGEPKGVMVRHRNCSNFLQYILEAFKVRQEDRVALVTSYSFDMTITSNWVPFLTGASLHILSEADTRNTEQLLCFLERERITFLNVTPSHFSLLVNTLSFMQAPPVLEKHMTIMLGAEIINPYDLNNWLSYYPEHRFINEYGPTEATVASTFFPIPVNEENKVVLKTVPIGKPIYNTQIYILDDQMEHCMPGVPGTLYIGGDGVARGYLNKPEKTAAAFIVNPLTNNPLDIIYNTGDLARFQDDGNIVFLGRKDQQVNFKGYRIELGDIEAALSTFEGVAEACAAMQQDRNKQDVLVAFYTSKSAAELSHREMALHLGGKLPEHMVPLIYYRLNDIPINTNGKLDRRLLPDMGSSANIAVRADYVPPRTETEAKFVKIWEEVLSVTTLGIHDNFWETGGDSIRSVRLIQQLRQAGYPAIRIGDIFSSPTIAQMSSLVAAGRQPLPASHADIVKLKTGTSNGPCLFCLPYAAGNPGMYAELCRHLPADYTVFSAQYPGHGDHRPPFTAIAQYTDAYLDFLCELTGPLFIVGYSFGGYIAYDLCRKCMERGKVPAGIIQVSTTPPGAKDTLMELLSVNDETLVARSLNSEIIERNLLEGLSAAETGNYMAMLKTDTRAMLTYEFSKSLLPVKGLFITGEAEEDTIIRTEKDKWTGYVADCSFKTLPGGHLLIREHARELAGTIGHYVTQCLQTAPAIMVAI